MLGFGRLGIVKRLDGVLVGDGASLLKKFGVHLIALVGFTLHGGREVLTGGLYIRFLDFGFRRAA